MKNRIEDSNAAVLEANGTEDNGTEKKAKKSSAKPPIKLVIPELAVKIIEIRIGGIVPLIMRAWDDKTAQMLADKAKGVKAAKSRENVVPEDAFNAARYISTAGWDGVPAGAFKASLIDAVTCNNIPKADFNMTLGKKTFFIRADGVDKKSGRSLVRIYGQPEMLEMMQRTTTGMPYMSYRPIYRKWSAILGIEYNAARIDAQGVMNLLSNAGYWVGVGEHRPSAPESKTGENGRWEVLPADAKMVGEGGAKRSKGLAHSKD
jgi:hypothetical protein